MSRSALNIQKKGSVDMEYICYHASWCPFCRSFIGQFRELVDGGKDILLDDEGDPLWIEKDIELVPTIIEMNNGEERRRLVSKPGMGITREMLLNWLKEQE
jgi:thiol-disulfide isomerase/thioredoxin